MYDVIILLKNPHFFVS